MLSQDSDAAAGMGFGGKEGNLPCWCRVTLGLGPSGNGVCLPVNAPERKGLAEPPQLSALPGRETPVAQAGCCAGSTTGTGRLRELSCGYGAARSLCFSARNWQEHARSCAGSKPCPVGCWPHTALTGPGCWHTPWHNLILLGKVLGERG